jgi:HPt (histidine-containing phosphotransfer) domain-containing protein
MSVSPSASDRFPADLLAEFDRLKRRIGRLLDTAAAGTPDWPALIDHLHRLGGAAGLFGEEALGAAAKRLGERIECAPEAVQAADYAALAALIAAS